MGLRRLTAAFVWRLGVLSVPSLVQWDVPSVLPHVPVQSFPAFDGVEEPRGVDEGIAEVGELKGDGVEGFHSQLVPHQTKVAVHITVDGLTERERGERGKG